MRPCGWLAALVLAIGGTAVHAGSAADLVERGNQAFAAQKLEEALDCYEKAGVSEPESPLLVFNKGAVYYRRGDYEKAREAFEQATLKTRDFALEARTRYNLGNCHFREGERQKDSDPRKALEALGRAVGQYQEALKLDAQCSDAAHNLEVTRLVMKQLLDELKKRQEEAQKQQQAQEDLAKKIQELLDRQQKAVGETKSAEKERAASGQAKAQERAGQMADNQKQLKDDTQKLADALQPPPPDPKNPNAPQPPPQQAEVKQHLDQSADAQGAAEERLRKEALADARSGQEKSAEELRKALDALKQQQQQQQQGGQQDQKEQEKQQDQAKDQQGEKKEGEKKDEQKSEGEKAEAAEATPADEAARDILNDEKENRQRRALDTRGAYREVDKDW